MANTVVSRILCPRNYRELKAHADKIGMSYSCSVWDITSARDIVSLQPDLAKVGSPSNMHWEMMAVLRDEYTGYVHISTGMTTPEEIEQIVQFWEQGKEREKTRYSLQLHIWIPSTARRCLSASFLNCRKYSHSVKAGFLDTTMVLRSTVPRILLVLCGTKDTLPRIAHGKERTMLHRSSRVGWRSWSVT